MRDTVEALFADGQRTWVSVEDVVPDVAIQAVETICANENACWKFLHVSVCSNRFIGDWSSAYAFGKGCHDCASCSVSAIGPRTILFSVDDP